MAFQRCLRVGAGLLSTLLLSGSALAVGIGFSVSFEVTGGGATAGSVVVPVTTDVDGNGEVSGFNMSSPGEWDLTINAFLDPDPEIIYAVSVIDFGAASTFGFSFVQGIVGTPAPGLVSHTHSSSTTDGGGGAGTPVTAAAPPAGVMQDTDGVTPDEIAVFNVSTNGGTTYLSAGLDLNPSFTGAAPSDTQGAFNEGPIAGPAGAGFYNAMRVDANFSMTGSSDAFTFNGKATVVPEPGTSGLVLLGLAGLGLSRRGRAC